MTVRPLSRRGFLLAAGGMVAGAAGGCVDAFTWAPSRIQFSRFDVTVPGLHRDLDGLTIAQLTDLHLHDGLHAAARRATARPILPSPTSPSLFPRSDHVG